MLNDPLLLFAHSLTSHENSVWAGGYGSSNASWIGASGEDHNVDNRRCGSLEPIY
jgi:hypothetical protein